MANTGRLAGARPAAEPLESLVTLRRILIATALTAGAVVASAAPASADGCGTVYVKGFETVEVCNPVVETVEDLLELS